MNARTRLVRLLPCASSAAQQHAGVEWTATYEYYAQQPSGDR